MSKGIKTLLIIITAVMIAAFSGSVGYMLGSKSGSEIHSPSNQISASCGVLVEDTIDEGYSVSFEDFDNIMGMYGVIEKTETLDGFCTRSYYVNIDGETREIAWSTDWLAGKGTDYAVDIDGDGITELLCNEQSGCGHIYLKVFKNENGVIKSGYVDLPQDVIDAYGWWGHEALDAEYNPNSKEIDLTYYDETGKIVAAEIYPLDKAEFSLEEYDYVVYDLEKLSNVDKLALHQRGPFNCFRGEMAFDDVLGTKGAYIERGICLNGAWLGDWVERVYYAYDADSGIIIAESFGYESDYIVDIDSDGEKELICNCESIDGLEKTLRIFKRDGNQILLGTVNTDKLKFKNGLSKDEKCEVFFDNATNWIRVNFPEYPERTGRNWCGVIVNDLSLIEYCPFELGKK